jgi:hypothetical protein
VSLHNLLACLVLLLLHNCAACSGLWCVAACSPCFSAPPAPVISLRAGCMWFLLQVAASLCLEATVLWDLAVHCTVTRFLLCAPAICDPLPRTSSSPCEHVYPLIRTRSAVRRSWTESGRNCRARAAQVTVATSILRRGYCNSSRADPE